MEKKERKIIYFKPNKNFISGECITNLDKLRDHKELGPWISRACEFYYNYEHYKKSFLINIIQSNYESCKYILRIIGRSLNLE